MKKRLLMLDLDGTIADTIWSIRDAVNMTMDIYGFPKHSYEYVRASVGRGVRDLVIRSLPKDKRDDGAFIDKVLSDYNSSYEKTYFNVSGCYEGMEHALRELKERGYMLAVLSNKPDAYVKTLVKALLPDGIVSLAMGQTELPLKPDPTVPLMIAEELGIRPQDCAFIGDSEIDVMTAKNAGMTAVACSWGYRPRELLAGADMIIEHPSELTELFD